MRGFGNLKDIDKLKAFTESIQEEEIIESKPTDEENAKLENVSVVKLKDDIWQAPEKKSETLLESGGTVKNEPEDGAAGNKEDKEDKKKEPILGGMGLGLGAGMGKEKMGGHNIAPEMEKKGLEEGFDKEVTVDEDPTKEASEKTKKVMSAGKEKNTSIKTAKDMMDKIDVIRGIEYDFDSTKNCGSTISKEPINTQNPTKKIPKGW